MNNIERYQRLNKKVESPNNLYAIEQSYLDEILRDIGRLFVNHIAHDESYNILDAVCHAAHINDLTVHQKCYLMFFLGKIFGQNPHEFENLIISPILEEVENDYNGHTAN